MAIDFRTEQVTRNRKGWVPKADRKTRLLPGWEPRPEFGVGQEDLLAPDRQRTSPLIEAPATAYDEPSGEPLSSAPVTPAATPPAVSRARAPVVPQGAPAAVEPPARRSGGAGSPPTGGQAAFTSELQPIAQRVAARTGIPWQALMAIPANETGWGQAVFHNNYFGIKGPGARASTWEVVDGQRQDITDSFRVFGGAEDAMNGFVQFLHDNSRYATALKHVGEHPDDWPTFIRDLHQAGYATDPNWSNQVISIGERLEGNTDKLPLDDQAQRTGVSAVNSPRAARVGAAARTSQFALSLSSGDAYAFCGPAAAIAFAKSYGRNPTAEEAKQLAQMVGWNPHVGMAGPASEVSLLRKMGVAAHMTDKIDWSEVREDARSGNPVIVDTPGHYFYIDGYDEQSGKYHLGTSATDLIASHGREWFAADEISGLGMGAPRAAIFADSPITANESVSNDRVVRTPEGKILGEKLDGDQQMRPPRPPLDVIDVNAPLTMQQAIDQYQREHGGRLNVFEAGLGGGNEGRLGAGSEGKDEHGQRGPTMSKRTANYRPATSQERCGVCSMFRPGGHCTLVIGEIKPYDVCDHFEPKGKKKMGAGQDEPDEDERDYSFLDTPLSPAGEGAFQAWKARYAPKDSGWDYDLRGAFAAGLTPDPETGHWPDTFKKPNHPTFSDQSKFAKDYPERAGHWDGETYVPPARKAGAGQDDEDDQDSLPILGGLRAFGQGRVPPPAQLIGQPPPDVSYETPILGGLRRGAEMAAERITSPPEPLQTEPTPEQLPPPPKPRTAEEFAATGQPPDETPAIARLPDVADVLDLKKVPGGEQGELARAVRGEQLSPSEQITAGAQTLVGANRAQQELAKRVDPLRGSDSPLVRELVAPVAELPLQTVAAASLAVPGGRTALGVAEAAAAAQSPEILGHVTDKDAEGLAADAATVALAGLAVPVGGATAKLTRALIRGVSQRAGAAAAQVDELAERLVGSPVGRVVAAQPAQVSAQFAVRAGAATGLGGVLGGGSNVAADLNEFGWHPEDPSYWAKVQSDFVTGAKYGSEAGLTFGLTAMGMKWGWDKTIGPAVAYRLRREFSQLDNIPSLNAREAMGTRSGANNRIQGEADRLKAWGEKLFGPAGQGLNTAEAAAYIEKKKTIRGFVSRDGKTATPEQALWVDDRVVYEHTKGVEMRQKKVLSPTQDVTSPVGAPGPSTHMFHAYKREVQQAQRGRQRGGLSWRTSVAHKRDLKTIDPNAPPDTPRTIEEAISEFKRDPVNNLEPLDSMVDRYAMSFEQTERALNNRAAWDKIRGDRSVVLYLTSKKTPIPEGWVKANPQWGLGRYADRYVVHKELARYFDNITGVSTGWADNGVYRLLQDYVNVPEKLITFASSPVHAFNVGWRVLTAVGPQKTAEIVRSYVMPALRPGGLRQMMIANPQLFGRAAQAGVTNSRVLWDDARAVQSFRTGLAQMGVAGLTSAGAGWAQAKARGETDDQAFDAAWKLALVGSLPLAPIGTKKLSNGQVMSWANFLHQQIFERSIPAAKIGMFDVMTRAGMPEEAAATYVNQTLGGINLMKIGRAPWLQDAMRIGLLASDWEEANLRMWGNVFAGGPVGAASRRGVLGTLVSWMGVVEGLNILFNQHPTWQNEKGHEFEVETTGMYAKIAQVAGDPNLAAHDPRPGGAPMRAYTDVLPPYRTMFQVLGELGRTGASAFGGVESALGEKEIGERLQRVARGDLARGETPPDPAATLAQYASYRKGAGLRVLEQLGALGAAGLGGRIGQQWGQTDLYGRPYDPPGIGDNATWQEAVGKVARALNVLAPATTQNVARSIDIEHPQYSEPVDAIINYLGFARTYRTTEQAERMAKVDAMKLFTGYSPRDQAVTEQNFQQTRARLDKEQVDYFASLGPGGEHEHDTHAQIDQRLHDLQKARQENSRSLELTDDYIARMPEDMRPALRAFFLNSSEGVVGSQAPADVPNGIDLQRISQAFWNPVGVDPKNQDAFKRAQNNALLEMADQYGTDRQALSDWLKWEIQNKDLKTGAVPPVPTLGHMTSGELSNITTEYLKRAEDTPGHKNEDVDARTRAQRDYLDEQAAAHGVSPEVLLKRINLRLSPLRPMDATEQSYQKALQLFFESHDDRSHPRYLNPDGTPHGSPEEWKAYDQELAAVGAERARRSKDLAPLLLAQERGTSARKRFLMDNKEANKDYERFFGLGRAMDEPMWAQYTSGNVVGYADLKAAPNAPKGETIRRDKIIELYNASTPEERYTTKVYVWDRGQEKSGTLANAHRFLVNPNVHINTAGRKIALEEAQAAATQDAEADVQ